MAGPRRAPRRRAGEVRAGKGTGAIGGVGGVLGDAVVANVMIIQALGKRAPSILPAVLCVPVRVRCPAGPCPVPSPPGAQQRISAPGVALVTAQRGAFTIRDC